jgi:hypothetical protein
MRPEQLGHRKCITKSFTISHRIGLGLPSQRHVGFKKSLDPGSFFAGCELASKFEAHTMASERKDFSRDINSADIGGESLNDHNNTFRELVRLEFPSNTLDKNVTVALCCCGVNSIEFSNFVDDKGPFGG